MTSVYSRARPRKVAVWAVAPLLLIFAGQSRAQEVVVLGGIDRVREFLETESWWGEVSRGDQLAVPHVMMTGINPRWRETAQQLPVSDKKEVFYRLMLPLVVHANELITQARERLLALRDSVASEGVLTDQDSEWLAHAAEVFRVDESGDLESVIDELLVKVDVIPAGLVLGQAAYESGYGTSRFAVEGNALFGQWVFGGDGMVPEQQRESLGDHRIAAYDWPFDSVRGYFINLNAHPAYARFRELRAEQRASGEPLDSLSLADGLTSYSERGQEYVDTLKGMIRVNKLDIADGAAFRDEPMRFLVGAADQAEAVALAADIEGMRASGELARIIERMRLD